MNKICYVDQTIRFSNESVTKLQAKNFDFKYLHLQGNIENIDQINFLLVHSFIDDQILSAMKNCKYIGIRAHNTDYVNKNIAVEMGINVCGLKNQYGINAVAEHTFALIFGLAKNLLQAHENVKSGKWRAGLALNMEFAGKKLGIIGYGKIGKRVAEIGTLLGMEVLIAAKGEPKTKSELPLEYVLRSSDIITILIPGTEANRNFFNAERIAQIKPGAMVINTARGSVADYQALENALKVGKISGLGLDVYPEEPVKEHPLCSYPNVICTPHLAYNTKDALEKMNTELIVNLLNFAH